MNSSAVISDCGRYRYLLTRQWAIGHKALFVMLNPSTADETKDDPTLRKCIKLAQAWGYAGLEVVNLFAWRSSKPKDLWSAENPIGPENDDHIKAAISRCEIVIAAWGNNGHFKGRNVVVAQMAQKLYCLGETQYEAPKHPLARGKHAVPMTVTPTRYWVVL